VSVSGRTSNLSCGMGELQQAHNISFSFLESDVPSFQDELTRGLGILPQIFQRQGVIILHLDTLQLLVDSAERGTPEITIGTTDDTLTQDLLEEFVFSLHIFLVRAVAHNFSLLKGEKDSLYH